MAHPIIQAYSSSDAFGKIIFLSLFSLSILSWVLIVYKVWLAKLVDQFSNSMHYLLQKSLQTPLNLDLKSALGIRDHLNPYVQLYQKVQKGAFELLKNNKELTSQNSASTTVFLSTSDIEQLESLTEVTINKEKKQLEKYLFVLSTVFSLAPLLGLLGTVWGISVTFNQLPNAGHALSNDAVLSGLSMALGTTVLGIVVAIPALIGYNYLKHRFEDCTQQMDHFCSDVLSSIETQYRAVDVIK